MTTQPHGAKADPIEVDWSWTASDDDWVPPEIDTSKPSTARMYDYALGGKDNYAIDRQAVDKIAELLPDLKPVALANRGFMIRAVEALSRMGIDQFLDLGSGIPTSPNVHEVAGVHRATTKVVYVDNDPIVMTYNRALREPRPGVLALNHDMRAPATIFEDPALRAHLDLERPIGLLLVAVLHFVQRETRSRWSSSTAGCSHPGVTWRSRRSARTGWNRPGPTAGVGLSDLVLPADRADHRGGRAAVRGNRLIEPGLVDATQWRNNETPLPIRILSGVGQVL